MSMCVRERERSHVTRSTCSPNKPLCVCVHVRVCVRERQKKRSERERACGEKSLCPQEVRLRQGHD